jgi:hypothetical protein
MCYIPFAALGYVLHPQQLIVFTGIYKKDVLFTITSYSLVLHLSPLLPPAAILGQNQSLTRPCLLKNVQELLLIHWSNQQFLVKAI